jgi:NADP-dependent 3-hydroxy acid dehydrogenase YdfG
MRNLEGQGAIVTGGGTGIGRAAAVQLAAEGARVLVAGRRSGPLAETVAEIERAGGSALARPADLGDAGQAAELGRFALERLGRVDLVVHNAGLSSRVRNVRWVGIAEWEQILAVNLTGVFALTQALLPHMLERGSGTIITVSSIAALKPGLLGGAPYGAAKAAVRNLMGNLLSTLRNRGIRATTILPAEVDTPILENRPLVPGAAERATMLRPEDVARAILFCATLPGRAVIEEIIIAPTFQRDQAADLHAAERLGAPEGGS